MFEVEYHPKVARDLKHISHPIQKILRRAIETKIAVAPEMYGKPLQFSLRGARSMRVGDYRIIFVITQKVVRIAMIGHRAKVYDEVDGRLS
jgi:addiction module RelE/StbE family toxin